MNYQHGARSKNDTTKMTPDARPDCHVCGKPLQIRGRLHNGEYRYRCNDYTHTPEFKEAQSKIRMDRPKKDITAMTDIDSRPRCKVCGRPMARSGMKAGTQQWRCRRNGIICSTFLASKDGPNPGAMELRRMAETMTLEQIAEATNSTLRSTSARLREYGIKAYKPPPANPPALKINLLERAYGSREAAVEYMRRTEISVAMVEHGVQEQMAVKWEKAYGTRFRRLCKKCGEDRAYDQMAARSNGQIQRICLECYVPSKNAGKGSVPHTGHAARVMSEYDAAYGVHFARQAWSGAQGINGFRFSMMGAGDEIAWQ